MVQRPLQPSDGRPIGSVGRLRTQGASRTLSRSGSGSGAGPGPGPALSCLDGRLVLAGSTCARASRKPPPAQRRPTAVGAEPEPAFSRRLDLVLRRAERARHQRPLLSADLSASAVPPEPQVATPETAVAAAQASRARANARGPPATAAATARRAAALAQRRARTAEPASRAKLPVAERRPASSGAAGALRRAGRKAAGTQFAPAGPTVDRSLVGAASDWRGGMRGLDLYGRAAAALLEADVLLISAGAGMSADSGLAVYKDIDKVTAWRKMGVTYADLCDPCWIADDPEIFYGFWGSCLNNYMDTEPHEGYAILRRWIAKHFAPSGEGAGGEAEGGSASGSGSGSEEEDDGDDAEESDSDSGSEESDAGSARNDRVHIYTSNVDTAFAKAGFAEDGVPVYEIHGSILSWQCCKGARCSTASWSIPTSTRFEVSPKTMRAKATARTLGWTGEGDKEPNHPRCPRCNARARPNILMFEDGDWVGNAAKKRAYKRWWLAQKKRLRADKKLKFVIVEIGAGVRIPTVRQNSERLLRKLPMGQARLIRINPDFELADSKHPAVVTSTIPIRSGAGDALRKIDDAMGAIIAARERDAKVAKARSAWQQAERGVMRGRGVAGAAKAGGAMAAASAWK